MREGGSGGLFEGGHYFFYEGLDGVEVEGGAEGDVEVSDADVHVFPDAVPDLISGTEEHSARLICRVATPGAFYIIVFLTGVGLV